MRILICSNAYPPRFVGGAELMAHEQAKALTRLGYQVRVFAGEPGAPRTRHSRADDVYEGIQIHRIALEAEDYSPEFLNFFHPAVDNHFRDVLSDFAPDIVHSHNLMGLSVKLPILARLHGAGTICTLHDFWGFCLRNTAVRPDGTACDNITQCHSCLPRIHDGNRLHLPMRLRKDFVTLALAQIDRFVTPSHHVAQRYAHAGWSSERIQVIPNGIDTGRFRPTIGKAPPSGPVRITYAGYFGAHKGVATLLDAMGMLSSISVPACLQLAGEGPEQSAYLTQIEKLGLQEYVKFLGKVMPCDMPGIYAQSDIVVLPSIWDENQPVCLMEAMASGLPVVASRKGGIPELVDHGVNGLLFTAGDANNLAMQLARFITDPDFRRRAGKEGLCRVNTMSHDDQARGLATLYAEVANPAFPARELVQDREIYAVTGLPRRRMPGVGMSLADGRYPSRRFLPLEWIADCGPKVSGVLLTGWLWSALRLLKIDAIVALPRMVSRLIRGKSSSL